MSLDFEKNVGRLGIWAEAQRPSIRDVRLEFNAYTDGITAGVTIYLLWLGAALFWRWKHENCPDCPLDEPDDAE